ncbi:hypothetical protein, partial [Streptomyces microflavus]|uniref:hypothetical protein n=1 Tax=Streptomyces microflavus TaxID=1919 RepID=UPI0033BE5DA3
MRRRGGRLFLLLERGLVGLGLGRLFLERHRLLLRVLMGLLLLGLPLLAAQLVPVFPALLPLRLV